jgi:YVTN family beta-propeller protein
VGDQRVDTSFQGAPGIRTFLIADVRGYTLFTQERGDEAAAKLAARFAAIAREVVEDHGGSVIELRGDEALAVFDSARQAILAAAHAQDRFLEETIADPAFPLPVGVGLDAGEAVRLGTGYRGGALNLAARLCGRAGPGEILASQGVIHLARRVEGIRYVERGDQHLKGLTEPVRVVKVVSEQGDPAVRFRDLAPRRPVRGPVPLRVVRRHPVPSVLVALFLAAAVAVPTTIALRGGGGGLSPVEPNSVGVIDPETGHIVRQIMLPNPPGSMVEGHGAVWVTAPNDGSILRIDVGTEAVVDQIPVGDSPAAVAVGLGAVWVVDSAGPSLVRVSPDTNEVVKTIPVGNGPVGVALAGGAVWVTNRLDGTVSRIDPETNEVTATVPVGDAPTGIAADEGGVWVANGDSGTVVRVDAGTNTLDRFVHVGNQPGPVAVGPDGVWVANTLDGTVSYIDPATGSVAETIAVGSGPSAMAFVGDSLWVASEFGGFVSQVKADTHDVVETIRTVSAPRGATAVGKALWVSVGGSVTSHPGGTLRVVSSALDSIDPAVSGAWWILINTNDGLLGWKRTGGTEGGTLVPDLAVSLPTLAEDGKTYRFQLRDGIRYSTGDPVRASDFRAALERGFRIKDSYLRTYGGFAALAGAPACLDAPTTCDLSEGVETDDAAGTITFHLVEPDPSFLYKLTLPMAYAVPAGAPSADTGTSPVPATGPYMIDQYVKGKQLVLVRNPRFHEWYAPAQPQGYPDRIVVTLGSSASEQLAEVERGRADWMTDWARLTSENIETLVTQYAGQVHTYPQKWTYWVALNTSMPPFNDPRARKAVNYALDRSEVVDEYGGPQRAGVTCQFLPPNLPGYRPYCPYTLEPNPAGQWTAPDLDQARRLVRASGTSGDMVALFLRKLGGTPEPVGRYLAGLLRELGYRVRFASLSDQRYFAALGSSDRFQAGIAGWISDFPAASDFFLGAPTCGSEFNPYSAAFCDLHLDSIIQRAERVQSSDPQRAGELFASADRRIVDRSPIVALTNPIGLDFVSVRVGNYQYNPQWGILLDQLWVQ